jgi:membrane associated rhomboid family serine protease
MPGQQQSGFGQGKITKGCLYLLAGLVGLSFFFLLSKPEMRAEIERFTAATGESVWIDFKIWQIATSPFLEVDFVSVLFQGFMLWMFLPSLERWWGTKRFLKFAAYTSITGVVVGTLVAVLVPSIPNVSAITGLDPLIYASIVAYGTLFANEPIRFFGVIPMTGRQYIETLKSRLPCLYQGHP